MVWILGSGANCVVPILSSTADEKDGENSRSDWEELPLGVGTVPVVGTVLGMELEDEQAEEHDKDDDNGEGDDRKDSEGVVMSSKWPEFL